jgi:hypothetical protein
MYSEYQSHYPRVREAMRLRPMTTWSPFCCIYFEAEMLSIAFNSFLAPAIISNTCTCDLGSPCQELLTHVKPP